MNKNFGNEPIFEAGKEKSKNCPFEEEASGKPTSSFSQTKERKVSKYITISDEDLWELIDKIMQIPEYSKSFNKVINHALKFGLVSLYDKLFVKDNQKSSKDIEQMTVESITKSPREKNIEDYLVEFGYLMKENIVYLTIIKSVVCSLFNGKLLELGGQNIPQKKYGDGAYRQTPSYLESYENRAFRQVREDD